MMKKYILKHASFFFLLAVSMPALILGARSTALGKGEPALSEDRGEEVSVGHGVPVWDYLPFTEDNGLVRPVSTPSVRISANYPRLDGAIAAWPVYAAFAQAVYKGLDENTVRAFVDCTNTVNAYQRLAEGAVDIFFGMIPSQEQRDYAASKGLTLAEVPIGKEAFVFFVHKDNPVRSLTLEQLRDVYSGRVTNWKELGGPDKRIMAFQRPEGSGSQTAMRTVMAGQSMREPQQEEFHKGMAGIIQAAAAYRNRGNALGYSFRWYATVLYTHPDIRLLAVDDVEPTAENIGSGAYPFTVPLLAVTARPLSAESQSLLTWITGHEGQDLLERVGYVPLR
jgi:phosphate transport system substrate-binding protein